MFLKPKNHSGLMVISQKKTYHRDPDSEHASTKKLGMGSIPKPPFSQWIGFVGENQKPLLLQEATQSCNGILLRWPNHAKKRGCTHAL